MESNKTKIKWVLVDIGDVLLLKNRTTGPTFTELLAEELGINIELAQKINKIHYSTMETRYVSEKDFITNLKNELEYIAPDNIYTHFSRAYEKQVLPNNELFDFLETVREKGIQTAILSNTIGIYRSIQEQLGISQSNGFHPILFSWELGLAKPDKAIFELALLKLKAKADEVIFIDDKVQHLQGAEAVGIKTIQYTTIDSLTAGVRKLTE